MRKGTAAKAMQQAWNTFRTFEPEVLFECHPDHIDIMEETLIARLKPELNGTRPADRLPGMYEGEFSKVIKYFQYSTLDHVNLLLEQERQLIVAEKNIAQLEEDNEELSAQRDDEEIRADVNNRIAELESITGSLEDSLSQEKYKNKQLEKLLEKANRSWWQKLFS